MDGRSIQQQIVDVGVAGTMGWCDLQRIVDTNCKMMLWSQRCSGYTGVKLGRKWLTNRHHVVDEKKKKHMLLKRMQKMEDGQVPGGRDWRIEGKQVRVTRKEFQRLKEEIRDSSFRAKREMWHLKEQIMRDGRRQRKRTCGQGMQGYG